MCPYNTLGVDATASETDIKQAYRKLVLQYHPDVNHQSGAERKFMSIQQAYELLTSKRRHSSGEGPNGKRPDWAFHDWYWGFVQNRRWRSHKRPGATAEASHTATDGTDYCSTGGVPPHKHPEHQSVLRTQLAGLRHRAAIRSRKQQARYGVAAQQPAASAHEPDEAAAGLDIDSTEMSDGCNMASGITDWESAEQQHAAEAARRFSATESHRHQVMHQVAGLHRRAAASQGARL
eukprot:GHRR01012588.1.p1 GENE.GHRR01012588.1~~GHRR01012588.1.p1  ORF type:complete len:235 (+),score=83.65 GHRR01012588.1:418-1122(+)